MKTWARPAPSSALPMSPWSPKWRQRPEEEWARLRPQLSEGLSDLRYIGRAVVAVVTDHAAFGHSQRSGLKIEPSMCEPMKVAPRIYAPSHGLHRVWSTRP